MSTVFWTPVLTRRVDVPNVEEAAIVFEPPQPLMKVMTQKFGDSEFLRCPSFIESCNNAYLITAPMDVTVTINPETKTLSVSGHGWTQEFYDAFCTIRGDLTVSLPPSYIFYAKESVEMEMMPVFVLDSIDNARLVPGAMDIGKWVRPVDFSFTVPDPSKPVEIKRGAPLMIARFRTPLGGKVVLERVDYTFELKRMAHACAQVKNRVKKLSLNAVYELAASHIGQFMANKGAKK